MQHQLTPTVAVNGGYYFRYIGNQRATDNTLIDQRRLRRPVLHQRALACRPSGWRRLPGVRAVRHQGRLAPAGTEQRRRFARNFGDVIDQYQGFDFGVTGRFSTRTFVQGGVNAQKRVYDTCTCRASGRHDEPAGGQPGSRFCRQVTPYRPDLKFQASHTLPLDIVVSGAYQFSPGPQVTATWNAPNSIIAPALGRNLSAGATATKSSQPDRAGHARTPTT